MFSSLPRIKLSMMIILAGFSGSNSSTTKDPINPAPPVIRILLSMILLFICMQFDNSENHLSLFSFNIDGFFNYKFRSFPCFIQGSPKIFSNDTQGNIGNAKSYKQYRNQKWPPRSKIVNYEMTENDIYSPNES